MTLHFLVLVAGTLAFYAVYYLSRMAYHDITNPLRDLPGPRGGNLVVGHFRQLIQVGPLNLSIRRELNSHGRKDFSLPDKWRDEFGANYQSKGFFNVRNPIPTFASVHSHIDGA
jgi:hypothetical protein